MYIYFTLKDSDAYRNNFIYYIDFSCKSVCCFKFETRRKLGDVH